jgi:hypothetical protein
MVGDVERDPIVESLGAMPSESLPEQVIRVDSALPTFPQASPFRQIDIDGSEVQAWILA